MAVPVARVHLKVAHAALPALLPTPPKCKMLPPAPALRAPTSRTAAAILQNQKPPLAKPSSRADADDRWDARKMKPASGAEPSASSSALFLRSAADGVVRSTAAAGHGLFHPQRKNATSPPPPPMLARADAVERWDAHKKQAASPAPPSSSSGTTSLASSSKCPISRRATSAERRDVHKKCQPPQTDQRRNDGESSSTGSDDNDDDTEEEEEEILWKPRALYAGPGFAGAAPQPNMLPMPTGFLVHVA